MPRGSFSNFRNSIQLSPAITSSLKKAGSVILNEKSISEIKLENYINRLTEFVAIENEFDTLIKIHIDKKNSCDFSKEVFKPFMEKIKFFICLFQTAIISSEENNVIARAKNFPKKNEIIATAKSFLNAHDCIKAKIFHHSEDLIKLKEYLQVFVKHSERSFIDHLSSSNIDANRQQFEAQLQNTFNILNAICIDTMHALHCELLASYAATVIYKQPDKSLDNKLVNMENNLLIIEDYATTQQASELDETESVYHELLSFNATLKPKFLDLEHSIYALAKFIDSPKNNEHLIYIFQAFAKQLNLICETSNKAHILAENHADKLIGYTGHAVGFRQICQALKKQDDEFLIDTLSHNINELTIIETQFLADIITAKIDALQLLFINTFKNSKYFNMVIKNEYEFDGKVTDMQFIRDKIANLKNFIGNRNLSIEQSKALFIKIKEIYNNFLRAGNGINNYIKQQAILAKTKYSSLIQSDHRFEQYNGKIEANLYSFKLNAVTQASQDLRKQSIEKINLGCVYAETYTNSTVKVKEFYDNFYTILDAYLSDEYQIYLSEQHQEPSVTQQKTWAKTTPVLPPCVLSPESKALAKQREQTVGCAESIQPVSCKG